MYNVVKQIKRSFTVFTALIFTVITTRVRAGNYKTCGPEELSQCAKSLSILTDSGLSFVRNKEQLDIVCPDLFKSLSCIHGYSRLCMNFNQRKHFRKLFDGTENMVSDLCRNETYQEEFLSYAPCMQKVSDETEVCFKKYSLAMTEIQEDTNRQQEIEEAARRNQHHHHHHHRHHNKTDEHIYKYQKSKRAAAADESLKSVCCSFQEYVDCSINTIRKTCGEDAAYFSRGFLDKMASSLIKMHCMDYSAQDCKEKGFNIAGFHPEGYFYSTASSASFGSYQITWLSVLTLIAHFLR